MTSSNGNLFRVTGHLWGEFTGPRSPVNSPHKGQWRGVLMFTLICARINGWVNNREAGDLRPNRAHYGVMLLHATVRADSFAIGHLCWWNAIPRHTVSYTMAIGSSESWDEINTKFLLRLKSKNRMGNHQAADSSPNWFVGCQALESIHGDLNIAKMAV